MPSNLTSILNILATPPGDLIYHLVVSLALAYATGSLFIKQRKSATRGREHAFLKGCAILLLLQLSLFSLCFLITTPDFYNADFFHIFERLAATLTIIWLTWAFFDEDQREIPTDLYIILSITLIVLALVSVLVKPRLAVISLFNPLSLDLIWQLIALVMVVIGLMLAISIRPPLMKVLILILLLLASGHLLQIILINEMRWQMGAVRSAQILGLPWVLMFIKQFSSEDKQKPVQQLTSEKNLKIVKRIPSETKAAKKKVEIQPIWNNLTAKFVLAKSAMVTWSKTFTKRFSKGKQPEAMPEITPNKGYAEMTTDTKPALIDILLKINLAKTQQEKFQTIAQALSLSVVADICYVVSIPEEADKVHITCGYDLIREATLKADTLAREDLPRVMAAWQSQQTLTLSQDDNNIRDAQTLAMLLNYHTIGNLMAYPLGLPGNPLAGGVLFLSPYTGKHWGVETRQLVDEIKDTLAAVLFSPIEHENTSAAINQAQLKIGALINGSEKLRTALTEKEVQIREKETTIKGLKAKYQIEKMESMTRFEQMKQKIADLNARVYLQQEITSQLEQLQNENRLLVSEQEKLQAELNRAKSMLTELRTETGQTGPIRLSLESQIISLDSIAANARLRVAAPLQKNNIDLEIINPDGRLMIRTDPELLQTALVELLSNAILASVYGGTIRLEQKLSLEMGMLTVQITDFGTGLTQAEQTALFSAQHDIIPGIGSVPSVRNAIRAIRVLNGKIWLKSKKVSFTTFRFQIPVRIID
jgi:signal transduction histidine kinase